MQVANCIGMVDCRWCRDRDSGAVLLENGIVGFDGGAVLLGNGIGGFYSTAVLFGNGMAGCHGGAVLWGNVIGSGQMLLIALCVPETCCYA